MPRYRIHCLGDDGGPALKFFLWCVDDEEAVRLARKLRHPNRVEIFRTEAMVASVEGERLARLA
jgi:hypothetical protein